MNHMKRTRTSEIPGIRIHAIPAPSAADAAPRVAPALRLSKPRPAGLLTGDAVELHSIADRLHAVVEANEMLADELNRCYEQLGTFFEIAEDVERLDDPAIVEDTLMRRLGRMINAAAVFIDRGAECRAVVMSNECATIERMTAEGLRGLMSNEIDRARQRGRVRLLPAETAGGLGRKVHALIGGLRLGRDDSAAVIALREADQPAFEDSDRLAAESLLVYGGHVLSATRMRKRVERSALETVCALANVIEARDPYTSGHSERVSWLARMTGEKLGLSTAEVQELEWAGRLHDVGKIGIAERILNKPGALTEVEFEQIKQHPRLSYEMLRPVSSLGPALLDAVLHHHEDYDGSGYPEGLAGEEIPLGGRILRVVDVFDALTSTRPYRAGKCAQETLAMLAEQSGRETDPRVTQAFTQEIRRMLARPTGEFRRLFGHLLTSRSAPLAAEVGK